MKSKSLKQFKHDHRIFFHNGDIDQLPELHRVWRGYLITIAYMRTGYKARAWGENDAGSLFPIMGANYFSRSRTLEYVVGQMRDLIDQRINQKSIGV